MVSPPPDVGNQSTAPTASRAVASTPERGAAPQGSAVPALDRADIKPLDVTAALQILIAEVRESFVRLLIEGGGTAAVGNQDGVGGSVGTDDVSTADAAATGDAGNAPGSGAASGAAGTTGLAPMAGMAVAAWPPANADNPTSVARVLVEIVLQALPDSADETAWSEALSRAEAALQSGVQRAVDVVSAWRDVPPIVVQMTRESAGVALQVLGDDTQNPLWLSPEWLTMTPRLARFWRRRRILRRRLTDPDDDTDTKWDENDGYTP